VLDWSAYQFHPSFVLGFHGTEKSIVDKVVKQQRRTHLDHSTKSYDWLGHGVYFWENDPARGLEWAASGKKNGKIALPDVVGAIVDLGRCLDLTTQIGLKEVRLAHHVYKNLMLEAGLPMVSNRMGKDRVLRDLDCAVIETLHQMREDQQLAPYDSIRAAFPEDEPLYAEAGFRAKNHIQLCILNETNCIKGYFRPLSAA
jgi:hypothetical protein